jgi:hypothetical protein
VAKRPIIAVLGGRGRGDQPIIALRFVFHDGARPAYAFGGVNTLAAGQGPLRGDQDQIAPLRLSACCWFGELTFIETSLERETRRFLAEAHDRLAPIDGCVNEGSRGASCRADVNRSST